MTPSSGREDARPGLGTAGVEELLDAVHQRVRASREEQARWRLLLDAVVTMAADLTLDDLLGRIVEIAADLAHARYAALGVLSAGRGRRLQTFVTHGLTPEAHARIGDLPVGEGILGLIIDHPEPLRLKDLSEHPGSAGFPAHHPPMHSFLGVPVAIGGKVFGNLYLTEKLDGGEFTEQDEQIVVALAAAAGVAIDNARLHRDAARRERWLAATAEISAGFAGDAHEGEGLQQVVDLVREVGEADAAWVVTGPEPRDVHISTAPDFRPADLDGFARCAGERATTPAGVVAPLVIEDAPSDPALAALIADAEHGLGPVVVVPVVLDHFAGTLGLGWTAGHSQAAESLDVALPAAFAERVAAALHLLRVRADRERLAVFEDRDRIGRDLHDIVIQRLFAIGLDLQGALRHQAMDEKLMMRIDGAVEAIDTTIRDIRRTIFELGAMTRAGDLQSDVTQVVDRAAATLKVRPSVVFEGPVRSRIGDDIGRDILAVLGEALSNVVRHAEASEVSIVLRAADRATLVVADDGRGIAEGAVESGLANMRHRARKHGGTCEVRPGTPRGTVVEWSVPLR